MALKTELYNLLKSIARKLGFDVIRYQHHCHPLARRLRLMQHYGINLIVDVGAGEGQYAVLMRQRGYRGRIVSFEPLSASFAALQAKARRDSAWEAVNLALGDHNGEAILNIAEHAVASSLLPIYPEIVSFYPGGRPVASERVSVRTLDAVISDYLRPEDRPFLKLDTQGYEKRVLEGAQASLPRFLGLQLELSLRPLYQGEASFLETLDYTLSQGFTLMALEPGFSHPETGRMLQVDALFFREN
ncbi:MAG: FkbM family methyltransferase [Deltaproteobacteria bacterium]|nr:FkbM family methyltransferase [Deltaproteobacteria bacterium]